MENNSLASERWLLRGAPNARDLGGLPTMDGRTIRPGLLLRSGERFLLCQRPEQKAHGLLWEFAGGKVEPGETKRQALARECREELGVEIAVGEEFLELTHVYPEVTVHLTVFCAELRSGQPQALEHRALRWVTAAVTGGCADPAAGRKIAEQK